MKINLLLSAIALCVLLPGCNQDKSKVTPSPSNTEPPNQTVSVTPKVAKPKFTKENYPKVDGSTATIPLSESIASSILGMSKEEATKFIHHNTTHDAYVNLLKGTADIIFVTEPSEEELKLARDANIQLEITPVVKEGFVFLVNVKNPVNSLTTKQLQDIYQGKIKNWKEVGGEDKEMIAYQRNANSGSQTLMEQTVMKGLKLAQAPKNVVISEMAGLIESIAKYDNSDRAIGYSVYYYAKTMYDRDTIKFISVNGIKPDNTSISKEKYPFTSAYYAVIKKSDAENASSRKMIKWLLSEDGQKLSEEAGYVPVKLR